MSKARGPYRVDPLGYKKANETLDKMAENARDIGLDYDPSAGTQVSKVWRDGGKLVAKQVPLEDFYKPAQQEPVSFLDWYDNAHWGNEDFKAGCRRAWNAALAQRTWVGMTDDEIDGIDESTWDEDHKSWGIHKFARAIEAKLREKNT